MKKQKELFDRFLEELKIKEHFYENLIEKDHDKYFNGILGHQWIVFAFNWAMVKVPFADYSKKVPPNRISESNWKTIDNKWREVLKSYNEVKNAK